jgi:hypothetical protein
MILFLFFNLVFITFFLFYSFWKILFYVDNDKTNLMSQPTTLIEKIYILYIENFNKLNKILSLKSQLMNISWSILSVLIVSLIYMLFSIIVVSGLSVFYAYSMLHYWFSYVHRYVHMYVHLKCIPLCNITSFLTRAPARLTLFFVDSEILIFFILIFCQELGF